MGERQEDGFQSFGGNWTAIPGLGMAHVTSSGPSPNVQTTAGALQEHAQVQDANGLGAEARGVKRTSAEFEEGELSEGDMDDVYEPEDNFFVSPEPHTEDVAAPMDISNSSDDERELSYSPRLSPQERLPGPAFTESTGLDPSHSGSLETKRLQARDTIARLWQVNIGFQQLVNEGIDPGVLKELFDDLGLDIGPIGLGSATSTLAVSQAAPQQNTMEKPAPSHTVRTQTISQHHAPKQMSDPSESRKDRIARLLAARGSKAPSTIAEHEGAGSKAQTSTTPTVPAASKPKSDKSALLKEKMAALQAERARRTAAKATEAQAARAAQPRTAEVNARVVANGTDSSSTSRQTLESSTQYDIPGLSVPMVPTAPSNYPKRPRAADFGDFSATVATPPERSNDPAGEAKPFLIHVSDDESDAEMELDSPGPPSTYKQKSTLDSPTLRNMPPLSSLAPTRDVSAPGRINSPSGPPESRGQPNLQHMNRKIEEMKRRIAEAEARKRAKESLAGSRTPIEGRADDSRASSIGRASAPSTAHSPAPAIVATIEPLSGGDSRGRPLPVAIGVKIPAPTVLRRSRSRAASERIPHLEARRREQMLRLQVLQSQVASIEKEIAASKEEEARLIEEDAAEAREGSSGPTDPQAEGTGTAAPIDQSRAMAEASSAAQSSDAEAIVVQDDAGDSSTGEQALADDAPGKKTGPGSDPGVGDAAAALGDDTGSGVTLAVGAQDNSSSAEATEIDTTMADALENAADATADANISAVSESSLSENESDTDSAEDSCGGIRFLDDEAAAKATAEDTQDDVRMTEHESSGTRLVSAISKREVTSDTSPQHAQSTTAGDATTFSPYESPLSYFRAYRFHPEFKQNVTGGLRSLTYSNHVDSRNPLCPDELQGQTCPRGDKCQFQHFEMIQLPENENDGLSSLHVDFWPADDQILVQLGAAASLDEAQRQEYITGLRKLLTDYRSRKIRDFATISDGIIEYRAKFHGDKSKILPLGGTVI